MAPRVVASYNVTITIREKPSRAIRNPEPPTNDGLAKAIKTVLATGGEDGYFEDEITVRSTRTDK